MFVNREDAGRRLAAALLPLAGPDTLVLGLPRGGVPLAAQVADTLGAPLDVLAAHKVGTPFMPELAMGAVAEDGSVVWEPSVVREVPMLPHLRQQAADRQLDAVRHQARRLRGGRPAPSLRQRTVILVDDGLATGSTMLAAVHMARKQHAGRIVVAVPVGPPEGWQRFEGQADEFICLETPPDFSAVGTSYQDFPQVTDAEVQALLAARRATTEQPGPVSEEQRKV